MMRLLRRPAVGELLAVTNEAPCISSKAPKVVADVIVA